MPQVGIDTSEDAMPIEVGDPLIAWLKPFLTSLECWLPAES